MLVRILGHLRAQWAGVLALVLVLTGGVAYAANTVFSTDIVNDQVYSADVRNDTLTGGGLTAADLRNSAVGTTEIADAAVHTRDVQNESLTGADVQDFSLTNQDVGVLFAEVNPDGTVANSSGGVTSVRVGATGSYEVDFARDVSSCTAVATVGPAGAGSALGELNVADRSGNPEAVFVDTNNSDGLSADKPFRLVVVC